MAPRASSSVAKESGKLQYAHTIGRCAQSSLVALELMESGSRHTYLGRSC